MNTFNRIIKNKLYHHVTDVPDEVWTKIESRLPEKKNDFKLIWVMFAFIAIFVSGLFTYGYFSNSNNNLISEQADSEMITSTKSITDIKELQVLPTAKAIISDKIKYSPTKPKVIANTLFQYPEEIKLTESLNESALTDSFDNIEMVKPILEIQKIENILSNKTLKTYYKIVIPSVKLASD